MENTFDPDLINEIYRMVWRRKAADREKNDVTENTDNDVGAAGSAKKSRLPSANTNALKLSCELLRLFVAEAVHRAATIAEAEGASTIEATHLERILPQLLLDF